MKHVGFWTGDAIKMMEIDGCAYALSGWNGEKFLNCWKCLDEWTVDPNEPGRFVATPVYRFQVEGIDLDELEENSKEWENAVEIVDYDIRSC